MTALRYKSETRQLLERFLAKVVLQLSPEEYYLFECHRSDVTFKDMEKFLSSFHSKFSFRPKLNAVPWRYVLENKWAFHLHMKAFGVRVPPLVAAWFGSFGVSDSGMVLTSLEELTSLVKSQATGVAVKPFGGQRGRGVLILPRDEDFTSSWEGTALPHLETGGDERGVRGFVIEELLRSHEALAEIAPYGLNTIRIITLIDSTGTCRIHRAMLKLTRDDARGMDHWRSGSLRAPIDVETGRVGYGQLRESPERRFNEHPDTGVTIKGFDVPCWDETLSLVTKAALSVPQLRSVGWDVAITDDGPVVVEGNHDWGPQLSQGYRMPYFDDSVRDELRAVGYELNARTRMVALLRWVGLRSSLLFKKIVRR